MSVIGSNILAGASGQAGGGGYEIERSIRFNAPDSSYLNRTPSSSSNRKKWTWSGWVKRANSNADHHLFVADKASSASLADNTFNRFYILASGQLHFGGYSTGYRRTIALLRDPAAFYHLVLAVDTSQSAPDDRIKIYINGVQVANADFELKNNPSQNYDLAVNNSNVHTIGARSRSGSLGFYLDGYLAEVNFIDGQALDSSSFGAPDDNGVWQAIEYAGTYGTNGFHLDFKDNSSNAALGTDTSGNSNNFTVHNLTASSAGFSQYIAQGTTSGSFHQYGPVTNLFDGSASTGAFSSSGTSTFTFGGSPIVASTSIKIRGFKADGAGGNVLVNGTNIASLLNGQSSGGYSTVNVTSTLGGAPVTLASVSVVNAGTGGSGNIAQIFVDDVELITGSPSDNDSLVDTPSNGTASSGGDPGGSIVGNYATLSAVDNAGVTLSNGNLEVATSGWQSFKATIGVSSGKYYWESQNKQDASAILGVATAQASVFPNGSIFGSTGHGGGDSNPAWTWAGANYYFNATTAGTGLSNHSTTDIVMYALDLDNGKLWFGRNGTWYSSSWATNGNPATGANPTVSGLNTSYTYLPAGTAYNGGAIYNFGSRAFAYAAPTNFKSLNTANLPEPTIADGSKYFDTKLWTGNATSRNIAGFNMSPDMAWIKKRNSASFSNHSLFDTVRGATKALIPNDTQSESTETTQLTAFNSDGFSLSSSPTTNGNNDTFVAWAWDAGANSDKTYAITVANPGSGNKFYADGALQPTLTLAEGSTYKFDQSNSSNVTHPLRFSTTNNGTHGGGSEYTTGVTTAGTPGSAGAYTQIVIAASAPTLYAYCTAHSGMGFQINTSDKGGFTIPAGSLNSSVYDQSQTWSSTGTYATSGSIAAQSGSIANMFNGNSTSGKYINANLPAYAEYVFSSVWSGANTFTLIAANGTGSTGGGASDSRFQLLDASNNVLGYVAPNTASSAEYPAATLSNVAKIRWYDQTAIGLFLYGIKVNGKLLVDSGVSVTNVPTIASTVRANPSAGFSIVKYTGNGTQGATVGHGLNTVPALCIGKRLSANQYWAIYHKDVHPNVLFFNNSAAAQSQEQYNETRPTSSVVEFGSTGGATNTSGDESILYCFAPVEGYSSMGTYQGNSSTDGVFVHTGFKIAWLMVKRTDATNNWVITDGVRNTSNVVDKGLYADISSNESTATRFDFVSNGFKIRNTLGEINASGGTYIYMAFASHPFASNGGLAR